jgi:hypothetical protein
MTARRQPDPFLMTPTAKVDPCQFFKDALARAIAAREYFQASWGDLIDQGVPIDVLKRQLAAFDESVARANKSLYYCQHPVPAAPKPQPQTPEPPRILEIANADPGGGPGYYNNERPQPDHPGGDWASDWVQAAPGRTYLWDPTPTWEWVPVPDRTDEYDTKIAAVAGNVVWQKKSDDDVPFTHPFGFDWECFVSPDKPFEILLGYSNAHPPPKDEYEEAMRLATQVYDLHPAGIIGVETDQDLIPEPWRPLAGDRVAIYGRWIVDAGHPDRHTEIHPPLLIVAARADSNGTTTSTVAARPYLVSQEFGDGAGFQHLITEFIKMASSIPPLWPYPIYDQIQAHPRVFEIPFAGKQYMSYRVRPATERTDPAAYLIVSFAFAVRPGVTVWLFDESNDDDAVRVLIELDADKYVPHRLGAPHDNHLSVAKLDEEHPGLASALHDIFIPLALGALGLVGEVNPSFGLAMDFGLNNGLLTDRYDAPLPPTFSPTIVKARELETVSHYVVDPSQPFPVIGELGVFWNVVQKVADDALCERLCTGLHAAQANANLLAAELPHAPVAARAGILAKLAAARNEVAAYEVQIKSAGCKC